MKLAHEINIIVACEESQAVCIALRKRGFNAFSNDLLDCSGGHPEWHIKADIRNAIKYEKWHACIAFPPCTHLAVSGARYFKEKRIDGRQQDAIGFFMFFTHLKIPWCIENPIGIMSTHYRKPDQIIQPWQFGHGETKATCLWLNEFPKLKPTNIVEGREQRIWKMQPNAERSKIRSKTFSGIAESMAEQWGNYLLKTDL
jgi:hypothetical protein